MKEPLYISIKIFALILFIASFALPTHSAHAQEISTDKSTKSEAEINQDAIDEAIDKKEETSYNEISTSLGYVSYTDPTLWNNNTSYAVALRHVSTDKYGATYIEFEMAETLPTTSDVDGFRRNSSYQKLGFGEIYNKSNAPTTFFLSFGMGFINTRHRVQGVAAWQAPASDEIYDDTVIYQNTGFSLSTDSGGYVHLGLGVKINNRHKLSLYIEPILEGAIAARSDINDNNDNENLYNNEDLYYYGSIPRQIVNGMAGFRYSYIFQPEDGE